MQNQGGTAKNVGPVPVVNRGAAVVLVEVEENQKKRRAEIIRRMVAMDVQSLKSFWSLRGVPAEFWTDDRLWDLEQLLFLRISDVKGGDRG